jgi:hypothetical protein
MQMTDGSSDDMYAALRPPIFLLVIFYVVLFGPASSAGALEAATSADSFCGENARARDFLQPLKRVAPIDGPPREGRMPFAPEGLRLEVDRAGLIADGGWVGFGLRDEAIQHRRQLDWIVESELSRVSSRGRVLSSVDVKRQRIGSIEASKIKSLLHRVSGNPAYYRVDIRFFRLGTGRLLGEYSAYARVMRPRVDLRVAVDNPSVVPGSLVTARLINLGTVAFRAPTFTYGFVVQRFTGEIWTLVPENPPRERGEKVRKVIQRLEPGMELRDCLRYLVPVDQAPGQFRFISFGQEQKPLVAAQFEVRAP